MSELLLELFSEEIPALMQRAAEEGYTNIFTQIFKAHKIFAKVQVFSGPRRITVHVTHLPKMVLPEEVEIKGPAVDAPDHTIHGFCTFHNVNKLQLTTKLINNRLYYFYIKKKEEQAIKEVLPNIITAAISQYSWPKSMYWGNYTIKWIRPLRNILCIFDGEVLPITFGHLVANNVTYAYKITNKKLQVSNVEDYHNQLLEHDIILERTYRQEIIKRGLYECAKSHDLHIREDNHLIEEVTGLTEFPVVLSGKIPEKFLQLPKEVLIASMRTHQKYFCLFNKDSERVAPYFLFVANGRYLDTELVTKGNEKVLSARLSDALYFYKQDTMSSLNAKLTKLQHVIFHTKLGNLQQKTARIEMICKYLAPQDQSVHLAAKLCKADLVSDMVGEFPQLQGIMGYHYALHESLDDEISLAIRDHYKPQGLADTVPCKGAAIVAIADKVDNLVGLLLAGEIPTGSGDPYSLRRQTLGIIRIVFENNLQIDITSLLDFAIEAYRDIIAGDNHVIYKFFLDRLNNYLKNEFEVSLLHAAVNLELEGNLVNTRLKLNALKKFLSEEEGKELLIVYKRVINILGDNKLQGRIAVALLSTQYEKDLWECIKNVSEDIKDKIEHKDYGQSLVILRSLFDPITEFFDNVLINDVDAAISNNRLLLLQEVKNLFHRIANFGYL